MNHNLGRFCACPVCGDTIYREGPCDRCGHFNQYRAGTVLKATEAESNAAKPLTNLQLGRRLDRIDSYAPRAKKPLRRGYGYR